MVPNQPFYVSAFIRLLSVMRKSFTFNPGSFLKIRNNLNLSFNGSGFKTAASSNHPHRITSLGKIEAGLVAMGDYDGGNKVELYTNGHWVQQPPFPEDDIKWYSTATYENILYVFGE